MSTQAPILARVPIHRAPAAVAPTQGGGHIAIATLTDPASYWSAAEVEDVVAIAGDDERAVRRTEQLVRDVGATPYLVGGLDRARQIEEFAGMVISLTFSGVRPRAVVPA